MGLKYIHFRYVAEFYKQGEAFIGFSKDASLTKRFLKFTDGKLWQLVIDVSYLTSPRAHYIKVGTISLSQTL